MWFILIFEINIYVHGSTPQQYIHGRMPSNIINIFWKIIGCYISGKVSLPSLIQEIFEYLAYCKPDRVMCTWDWKIIQYPSPREAETLRTKININKGEIQPRWVEYINT